MRALIVEGGAMRGIFTAGILKAFSNRNYSDFDLFVGVSAGACNLASFLSNANDRNFNGYINLMSKKRFISWRRFFRGKHLMDLDWLWTELNSKYPLDESRFDDLDKEFRIVVTNISNGKAEYLEPNGSNLHNYLLASSSIPVAYRNFVEIDGNKYTDGGVSDPIPIEYCIKRGASEIVILRTRPEKYRSKSDLIDKFFKFLLRRHNFLAKSFENQSKTYNKALETIRENGGNINITQICPEETMQTERASRDIEGLKNDFKMGLQKGNRYLDSILGKI